MNDENLVFNIIKATVFQRRVDDNSFAFLGVIQLDRPNGVEVKEDELNLINLKDMVCDFNHSVKAQNQFEDHYFPECSINENLTSAIWRDTGNVDWNTAIFIKIDEFSDFNSYFFYFPSKVNTFEIKGSDDDWYELDNGEWSHLDNGFKSKGSNSEQVAMDYIWNVGGVNFKFTPKSNESIEIQNSIKQFYIDKYIQKIDITTKEIYEELFNELIKQDFEERLIISYIDSYHSYIMRDSHFIEYLIEMVKEHPLNNKRVIMEKDFLKKEETLSILVKSILKL